MKKKNNPDETIKMVSKIFENLYSLCGLFAEGSNKYLKTKKGEFEKFQNSTKISISEFLEI